MTSVKICGITNLEDALSAIKYGASYLGFIFAKESPRYIEPDKARKILDALSTTCQSVAVFKNEPQESLAQILTKLKPDFIQLHGDESFEYCQRFSLPIIKAIEIKDDMSTEALTAQIELYRGVSKFLLFDRPKNVTVDLWLHSAIRLLNGQKSVPAFFFAGGLTADNVAFAVQSLQPTAVDVASGVESSAGKKDATKMKDFCDAVKNVSKSEARRS